MVSKLPVGIKAGDKPLEKIKVSVTQLADFACRQGDLMPDGVIGPTAREGMRAHKMLQNERKQSSGQPEWLRSEVSISCVSCIDDMNITLGGRVDLIDSRTPLLTEIKTTLVPAEEIPNAQKALQWAQLYLYGYVYNQHVYHQQINSDIASALSTDPGSPIELELVHINIRAETQSSEKRSLSTEELRDYAHTALQCYVQWIVEIQAWNQRMVSSAEKLPFPFERFRAGQHDMAAAVYRACRDKSGLMCEAPTGIGKTVSSLFPAIKSLGEAQVQQVVYLTAKAAGRLSAEQAMHKLTASGLHATMIQIRAKQPTCFCSSGRCERDVEGRCPMTLGFFDRLPDARKELLSKGVIENEALDEVAWAHQLCPFELVLQLLPWVQVVIADYNYVFDPLVRIAHFSVSRKDTLLLIDEAHNLLDRSRSMYSAELSRSLCMQAANECRQAHPMLARELEALSRQLLKVADKTEFSGKERSGVHVLNDVPAALSRAVSAALVQLSESMAKPGVLGDFTSDVWRALCRYSVIQELYSDQHRCLVQPSRDGQRRQVLVTLYCLDASSALAASYRLFRATVLFSATLRPAAFYRNTLGFGENARSMQLSSPFDAQRCYRAVIDWIDTRYHHRQGSISILVDLIYHSTNHRSGNYLVFFPSYAYLEQVHAMFVDAYPARKTWVQSRGQGRYEQHRLLDELDTVGHRIGFAIQGGVFGEGIDYVGERLIGTLVVGTGLPAMGPQSELIAQHYRDSGHDGYDFAYRYPGFTRVLQTAGRVIRHETDAGFVLLVDGRFKQSTYRQLFPDDWRVAYPEDQTRLIEALENFWQRSPPSNDQLLA